MSAARDAILERIAESVGEPRPEAAVSRTYRRTGAHTAAERVRLFCERTSDYRADVRRLGAADVGRVVSDVCLELGVRRLGAPAGLPSAWVPNEIELVEDRRLTPHELDALDGVLTRSTLAIAETGTIVLTGGAGEGRRALTLVPDLHICVVEEARIVELVPEAMTVLAEIVARERRPITLVSGPSATSDIELDRVEGVHGPRTLVVLVTAEPPR